MRQIFGIISISNRNINSLSIHKTSRSVVPWTRTKEIRALLKIYQSKDCRQNAIDFPRFHSSFLPDQYETQRNPYDLSLYRDRSKSFRYCIIIIQSIQSSLSISLFFFLRSFVQYSSLDFKQGFFNLVPPLSTLFNRRFLLVLQNYSENWRRYDPILRGRGPVPAGGNPFPSAESRSEQRAQSGQSWITWWSWWSKWSTRHRGIRRHPDRTTLGVGAHSSLAPQFRAWPRARSRERQHVNLSRRRKKHKEDEEKWM